MEKLMLKQEFFGGILYNKRNKENLYIDELTYEILNILGENRTDYEKDIKKIKEYANIEEVLEILRELVENDIIILNVEKQGQGKIPKDYLTAPFRVFYDITYKCNLRCKHCFTNSGIRNDKELSQKEKIRLVEQLYNLGVERVSVAGGEPFATEDIYTFIEKCNEKGIDVSISTNGTYFTRDIINKINELNIKNITISFDGGTEESMDFIRGKGTYKKAIEGLKMLQKYYNKNYSIKTTLMKNNIKEVEKIIKIAIEYGCDTIKFNCVREDGRATLNKEKIMLSQDEYIDTVRNIERLKNKYQEKIGIRAPLNIYGCKDYEFIQELGFGCFAGKESICIDPMGNVKPCSHYPNEFICGNIKVDNLKDIWDNSEILEKFRKLKGNDTCNNCEEYERCRGGCRYRCFLN